MTKLYTDPAGPGSYEEILKHVEEVLRQNFELNDERKTWPGDIYKKMARGIVISTLHRLKIDVPGILEET